ncbi:expressed unknown protein [Seminavis robusta]|uniref:Uncharacterized protein n=1 Tax=Seminavis robusta TaxID=568900 RepID=A0A9N8DK09_9STRA|nr:expressed unknown protein [Seminavis robusta]|eukprot:Sro128_g061160.1 n/a (212) ;mRNA; f:38727-39362
MAPFDPPAKKIAVPELYDDEDDKTVQTDGSNDLNEPLLSIQTTMSEDEEDTAMKESSSQWSNLYSLIIGLIIGCFIQFSSLGANFLMTSMYGYNVFFMKEFLVVSLVWCFVTSIMGVCVLLFLRSLVVTSFYATTSVNENFKAKEDFIAGLIQKMEYYFAVGALIGVCMCWTITDIVLGMKAHIVHSLVTLVIALVWCRLVMTFCGSKVES